MYDFEACLQDKYVYDERKINNKTDLKEFIAYYSKEKWFDEWVNDKILNLNMDEVYKDILKTSKIDIPDNYKNKFKENIEQSISNIKNIYNKEKEQSER